MEKITKQLLSALIFTALSTPIFAGEKENAIIDKTAKAYGGASFLALKGLSVEDKYKSFRFGQSTSPIEPDIQHNHYSIHLDFENKRKEFQWIRGEGWSFSIFYDAGDYYVASDGYKDLTERFDKVKTYTGKNNPLQYQVVTHHHLDHLGGMNEAEKLGVTFVAANDHIETIQSMVDKPLTDDRFLLINSSTSIANDMVQAVDVPSAHASGHITVYFKEAKTLFTADTYLSRQESGVPNGHDGLARIKSTLAQKDIVPEHFAAAHSGRVLTKDEFHQSLQKRAGPSVCPSDWDICKKR